jgi:valyl-tRNA synthetase
MSLGKRLVTKIFNASKFAHLHLAEYDGSEPAEWFITDRWLLSKLGRVVESVTKSYEEYEFCDARSAVEDFFWAQLCDDYLELAKGRLYGERCRGDAIKLSAQATLYRALLAILRMFAPTLPHVTEEVYSWMYREREGAMSGGATGAASINAGGWPDAAMFPRDEFAEKLGDIVCELLAGVRKYKSEINVSIKRPIAHLVVARSTQKPPEESYWQALKDNIESVLLDLINAGNIENLEFADAITGDICDDSYARSESPNEAFAIAARLAEAE